MMRFFCATFYFLALFTGRPSFAVQNSELVKCLANMSPDQDLMQNREEICHFFTGNFSNCVEKNIYDSKNIIDQIIVRNINIKNFKTNFAYVCSKFNDMAGENLTCISNVDKCFNFKPEDLSLTCFNDIIPCIYKTILVCSKKAAMMFSKVLTNIKSTACKLSSNRYNLKPFYGPELDCYPKVQASSGTAAAKLGQNYKYFCDKFQKATVSQCIEDNLLTMKNDKLLDDDYIKKVKEFFRQRVHLCEYFSRYNHQTCSSLNVLSCQEDLYKTDALSKPFDVLLRSYAGCVYDKYKTCNATLAKMIKYNLTGNKSNSVHFSAPLLFTLSQLALIITFLF